MKTKAKKKLSFMLRTKKIVSGPNFRTVVRVAGYLQHGTHVTHVTHVTHMTDFMLYFAVDVFVCFNKNVEKELSLFSYSLR